MAALTADAVRFRSPTPADRTGRFGNTPAFAVARRNERSPTSGWTLPRRTAAGSGQKIASGKRPQCY
jgi:hypothetical protein